jgi:hypothetical protein
VDILWLALAVVLAYGSAIPGDFVWIDHLEIEEGGYRIVQSEDFGSVWNLTLGQYIERHQGIPESRGGYWRPLYALSLSLDWGLCSWW